jgi:hypothetical protein
MCRRQCAARIRGTELDTAFLWASLLMLLSSFAAYLIMKRIGILR